MDCCIFAREALFLELERRLPGLELSHFGHVPAERAQRIGGFAHQEAAATAFGGTLAVLDDDLAA